jgi:hypothetical protein
MTTLAVNIDEKKSKKAVDAALDTCIESAPGDQKRQLNKMEQRIYNNLKKSLKEIKLYQQGKIELQDAKQLLNKL